MKRALLSVSDKTGLVDFARGLVALDFELVSTGGTSRALREAGVAVTDVSDVTGFPECLEGRVKTLHPGVLAGVLAKGTPEHLKTLDELHIGRVDLVAVNLYPFQATVARHGVTEEDAIENIDVGGPTMIRAAAKNHERVTVLVDPADYGPVLEELRQGGDTTHATRRRLMIKVFAMTAAYDAAVAGHFASLGGDALPSALFLGGVKAQELRYGENPHQKAAVYLPAGGHASGILGAMQRQGKALSFNNLVDMDAAWALVREFDNPAAAIIKHTNPCGCAEQETLAEAYRKAYECDPVSAFGGVLGFNRPVDEETAQEIVKTFIEAIVAPDVTPGARTILAAKKNLRVVKVDFGWRPAPVLRTISGGWLLQTPDDATLDRARTRVVTERAPSQAEWEALEFAWKVVKHVKSNAIVYARAGQVVGVGAGQMSRVDSVKIGAMKAVLPLEGTVLASDAFFPFPDGVEEAARHGVTAVIQPGGSVRDEEVIAAANRLGLAMVFTGIRHFRH